ncbi:Methyl coenzyme M reductase, subunit D [Methanocella conradii HZ254]|uniref:Methyl coenzyme M reductase, subunit D n=1 Tax=Methanocella conradii (strain DSM 24694 / JCM 17849 / CGMCC 1.5162 / HZ254) TaxID=1041930 RepID=H8I4A8_METCZ|nr:methyl-coenzyme M reductase operon protein D [Methanocella conradii]AFC99665.1 Methyl coenzyme M reductase, subunit D [Methanocella conradii HZ254]
MVSPVTGKRRLLQLEIFPDRLLNFETAQKLLDELNRISGITRMVVYGPRLPEENPEDLLQGKFGVREKKYLDIMGEKIELTTQVGRVWIEIEDISVKDKIQKACEKVLPFPFDINEGLYLRTKKTITDYVRKGGNVDDISLGLFDPKSKGYRCCGEGTDKKYDKS